MKLLMSILFIGLLGSSAAGAAPLVVEALFDTKSRMPGVLIPFRVSGDLITGGARILEVLVEAKTAGVTCGGMVDLYFPDIIQVKCSDTTDIIIAVRVVNGAEFNEGLFGPYVLKYPAGGKPVKPTPVEDPNILAGKQLFNAFCVSCHNPPTLKRGRTAAQINGAITGPSKIPAMVNVKSESDGASVLTADEALKLEAYLKSI